MAKVDMSGMGDLSVDIGIGERNLIRDNYGSVAISGHFCEVSSNDYRSVEDCNKGLEMSTRAGQQQQTSIVWGLLALGICPDEPC